MSVPSRQARSGSGTGGSLLVVSVLMIVVGGGGLALAIREGISKGLWKFSDSKTAKGGQRGFVPSSGPVDAGTQLPMVGPTFGPGLSETPVPTEPDQPVSIASPPDPNESSDTDAAVTALLQVDISTTSAAIDSLIPIVESEVRYCAAKHQSLGGDHTITVCSKRARGQKPLTVNSASDIFVCLTERMSHHHEKVTLSADCETMTVHW